MSDHTTTATEVVIKGASVWGVIKITSWADLSYALAAVYTLILLGDWTWKNVIAPWRKKRGTLAAPSREAADD